ncbi:putative holin [Pseudomonas sp. IT-P4]|uniref:putative holin n=1 Tax=Pseudomonas sp. IT-P4 TaxID=3026446 RepID=UPI0039DF8363
MAEPSSSAVVAGAGIIGVTAVSFWPGVDVNAVVGAFAGGMFFVVFAKDLTALARFGYFIASWVLGYYVASEVVGREWARTSGLVAFFGALFCVAVCISLLEWFEGGKVPGWLRFIADRFGGRNG